MSIGRLRRAKAALVREGSEDALWLIGALDHYEAHAAVGLTLDRAAGLVPDPGKESWWTSEARERRDAALRRLRIEHFGEVSIKAAAREIVKAGNAHRTRAHSRALDAARALVAEAIDTGAPFPGVRQLQSILSRSE